MITFTLFDIIVLIIVVVLLALTGPRTTAPASPHPDSAGHAAPHFQRVPACAGEASPRVLHP